MMSVYNVKDPLSDVVRLATANFSESVDVVFMLDGKVGKSVAKGIVDLPCGLGRDIKIGVFADGDAAKEAYDAGADFVGSEDFVEKILHGNHKVKYDWFLSTPDLMPLVARLAKTLGPRGLMPNPKTGTVTSSFSDLICKIKKGRVKFKSDAYGLIHMKIGDMGLGLDELESNLKECVSVIQNIQVEGKKVFIKRAYLSTTLSKGSVKLKLN